MTEVDIIIFLIAGIVGAVGGSITITRPVNLAWLIITVWALLKILRVL